ncbi:hypothetical protein TrLO_g10963 [Triparma laevis f. longispina]|uniref:ADP-ribosylation factor-like protein 6 n=1 Tax=Triparma laevis f. longispina TaxID=1714387 RepID=A0A9W7AEH5_9STRA|nr:hypothetical protein TrLO_g10963 [Triparma laevis f. longispina]
MGAAKSRLKSIFGFLNHEVKILVIGLDNSGKTTLINHIKPSKASSFEVAPTVGYSVETFTKHNLSFTVMDMSGSSRYRSLWEQYYSTISAIIYVIDSTDKIRLCVARDELEELLEHSEVKSKGCPVLFFANKMDVPGAMTPLEVMTEMGLQMITNKAWHITSSNALTGAGVDEGISWLADKLLERQDYDDRSYRK